MPGALRSETHPELDFPSALGGTRTPNLLIRSQMLYPIELQALVAWLDTGRSEPDQVRSCHSTPHYRTDVGPSPGWCRQVILGNLAATAVPSRRTLGRQAGKTAAMQVHLVDGTYELFRQFFGQPQRPGLDGTDIGAVRGVLYSLTVLLADGATHVGVATDHVVESFRNDLWPGYKDGSGIDPRLGAQFPVLEDALAALGVVVWPMVELEADDALASAASAAAADPAVERVIVCTPDKDLAQCVVGTRVVQLDRRLGKTTDEQGVREKFGVGPASIPDWLALVGDSADGFPGLAGWGKRSAALVLDHYHHVEAVPDAVTDWDAGLAQSVRGASTLAATLAAGRPEAMLFRDLATLRVDRSLLAGVEALRWRGPTDAFPEVCRQLRDDRLPGRVLEVAARRASA